MSDNLRIVNRDGKLVGLDSDGNEVPVEFAEGKAESFDIGDLHTDDRGADAVVKRDGDTTIVNGPDGPVASNTDTITAIEDALGGFTSGSKFIIADYFSGLDRVLKIEQPVTFQGRGWHTGFEWADGAIDLSDDDHRQNFFINEQVTFRDLMYDGGDHDATTDGYGILCRSGSEHSIFDNVYATNVPGDAFGAIRRGTKVVNCRAETFTEDGVEIIDSGNNGDQVIVANCYLKGGWPIHLFTGVGESRGAIISNCHLIGVNSPAVGLHADDADHLIEDISFSGNHIHNTDASNSTNSGHGVLISGNGTVKDISFSGGGIYKNGESGVHMRDATVENISITSPTHDNGTYGIRAEPSATVRDSRISAPIHDNPNGNVAIDTRNGVYVNGYAPTKARLGSTQTVSDKTVTQVNYNGVITDAESNYDPSASEYIAPTDGRYELSATAVFASAPNAPFEARLNIQRNGNNIAWDYTHAAIDSIFTADASTTVPLSKGDIVTVNVYQQSGTSIDLTANSDGQFTRFHAKQVD